MMRPIMLVAVSVAALTIGGAAIAATDPRLLGASPTLLPDTEGYMSHCWSNENWEKNRLDEDPVPPAFAPTEAEVPAAADLREMARGAVVTESDWLEMGDRVVSFHGDVVAKDRLGGGRGWGLAVLPHDRSGVWRTGETWPWSCDGSVGWHRWQSAKPHPQVAEFWVVDEPEFVDLDLQGAHLTVSAKKTAPENFIDGFTYRWRTSAGWSNVAAVKVVKK